jgi:hypothetical protein
LEPAELNSVGLEKYRALDVHLGGVPVTMSMTRQGPFGESLGVINMAR